MQRVSTAFVGQVSAASSPATTKLKGRARATNDPAYVPLASSHRAQSRRRRDLVAIFLDAVGGRTADAAMDLELLVKIEGELGPPLGPVATSLRWWPTIT